MINAVNDGENKEELKGNIVVELKNIEEPIVINDSKYENKNETNFVGSGSLFTNIKDEITSGVSKLHLEKYLSFINDTSVKQIVIILTNDSAAVQDVVNMIDLILSDGKIDLEDAPLLLGLVKKIVALRTKNLPNMSNITISQYLDVIKLVFTILAKEGILKIEKIDEFITNTTMLIELIKKGEQFAESIPCFAGCFGWVKSKIK